ncbi:uncharacterized protein F4812DRAFT_164244 [Daldinia caldariorum]|uniref:uncharacterized protein n=1 Tax=Daldinia caldariorum TaxID=326644 RepID=UPI002008478A|nr:uncharacterized protein F4812DRAFT_164244 [Daldinia caldariorum]KAI1471032.1 hypothetical protein F4812DRAFT_164244 [Daldinia caldariorum]
MSTGGTGGNPIPGFHYGGKAGQQNVDVSDDPDPKGTAAGYVPDQNQGKSLLGSIKNVLKPGDSKKQQQQQGSGLRDDFTHDGRHGGVEETMIPGRRDYDESREGQQNYRDAVRTDGGGSVLESIMPGKSHSNKERRGIFGSLKSSADNTPDVPETLKKPAGGGDPGSVGQNIHSSGDRGNDSGLKNSGDLLGKQERHSKFDKSPATENYAGPEPDSDSATKASASDSQGSAGHQSSSEGAISGTIHKIAGLFSKEGAVGRQFTDKGAVGGTVRDTMGHGDKTRKGE